MKDHADPNARERAVETAREEPPTEVSPDEAVAEVRVGLEGFVIPRESSWN